ncbi:MAG: hypothetical protein WC966_00970 [Bradymonadales bacterium]|jgi:hypothetical protein
MKRYLIILGIGLGLVGCKENVEEFPKHEQVESEIGIDLPAIPDFAPILNTPRRLADGRFTVWGLIFEKKKNIGKSVRVAGQIRSVSEDCPFMTNPKEKSNRPRPGQRELRRCSVVYITIADSADSNKELLVVDYHPYFHPHFEVGMPIELTGRYNVQGAGFVRPRDGLLMVDLVENYAVDWDGNFTNDLEKVKELQSKGLQAGMQAVD